MRASDRKIVREAIWKLIDASYDTGYISARLEYLPELRTELNMQSQQNAIEKQRDAFQRLLDLIDTMSDTEG